MIYSKYVYLYMHTIHLYYIANYAKISEMHFNFNISKHIHTKIIINLK
jgi:hypothetical protein